MTEPTAEISATAEPEMPERNVVATMSTTAKPPRRRKTPTSALAKATSRRAMPPSAMIAPASTKKGMVSIENFVTPAETCNMIASGGRSIHQAAASAASPSA